jgi:hypothetical protein
MFPSQMNQPMIVAFDHEPLFHSVVWAHIDIILQAFPRLGNGVIREMLKDQDLIPEGIGFAQQKELGDKCIGAFLPG